MRTCTLTWYDTFERYYDTDIDYTGGIYSACHHGIPMVESVCDGCDGSFNIDVKEPRFCPCCGTKVTNHEYAGSIEENEFRHLFDTTLSDL